MEFEEIKKKIKSSLKRGEKQKISDQCGVTLRVFLYAMKCNSWDELTKAQEEVIHAAIKYISDRDQERANAEQFAS